MLEVDVFTAEVLPPSVDFRLSLSMISINIETVTTIKNLLPHPNILARFGLSVFAGEQLRCTITFRNVANLSEPVTPAHAPRRSSRRESISQIASQAARIQAANRVGSNGRTNSSGDQATEVGGRHRPNASFHTPTSTGTSDNELRPQRPGHKQQRSVSIISVTSPITAGDLAESNSSSWAKQQRLSHHQRSSTVGTQHAFPNPHNRRESPTGLHLAVKGGRRSPLSPATSRSRDSTPDFKFPPDRPDPQFLSLDRHDGKAESPVTQSASHASQVASERSSGDFYSLSNHSQETLMSEQPSVLSDIRPTLNYGNLNLRKPALKPQHKPQAVNLLMGYAQLGATFTLDASLIDQSHFEEVKNKGFHGGQAGGGVVGVKKPRPNSGFLGTFNFNSIGDSLNSLMGGDNMSSVKEMHAVTNARAIPLLSTPQSLLFVDLHLEPGEERSFSYNYPLPHGLPSSHRGKAIKISYNLTIGVQGLPGGRDAHTVRQVNIPVRVFSGVNYEGEIYGHDLMQPHVILRDLARTRSISSPEDHEEPATPTTKSDDVFTTEFLQFVDNLLDRNRRRQSSSGTMEAFLSSQAAGDHRKAVQSINRAILFGNQLQDQESSSNRFDISRNGLRVAVIVIDRPLHRLGETVTAVIDFSEGQVPCSMLRSTLETSEKVTPSLAVRSAATISRITRKTYVGRSENVLFSKRATFAPSIPASATPTFVTTGVNLEWSLRFEFGTIKTPDDVNDDEGEPREVNPVVTLLEEIVKDERGTVNVAVENLECETFEVVIPITVYGDLVPDGREGEEVAGVPI